MRRGDVVLTSEAPLGRVARIDTDGPVVLGQRVFGLRGKSGVLDSGFLFYAFQSEAVQSRLKGHATGTTVLGIRQPSLLSITIPAPGYAEQRAIAEVLGALDDKIAANANTLKAAQGLVSEAYSQAVADGLRVPLSSLARFVNGGAHTKGASGTGRVVVRIAELNNGIGASTVFSEAIVPTEQIADAGDILFAWSGSLTVHRWFRSEAIINQHIFKVLPDVSRPAWLVYESLVRALSEFKAIAADKATTMGHIKREHLDVLVPIPTDDLIKSLDGLLGGLWNLSLEAEQESERLAALRDTLLPALMSGKLRVKDAERTIEEVL